VAKHGSVLKSKGVVRILVVVLDIHLCSVISLKRSRQELSINVAEHGSILKSKELVRTFVIFQDRPNVQPFHSKGLGESFPLMWLNMGLCW